MKPRSLIIAIACGMLLIFGNSYADVAGGDAAAGKTKAASCSGCHGANGEGKGTNPAIAGMDAAQFSAKMAGYKSGATVNPMMNMAAKKLSDEDIANLAAYYASLSN